MDLLSKGNTKVLKTNDWGMAEYSMKVMHLSPSDSSGIGNTCGKETTGCKDSCFRNNGHFLHKQVRSAHDKKTEWYFNEPQTFKLALLGECVRHEYEAKKARLKPVVRLNGTSDIAWEEWDSIFQQCPDTQFLDYTKHVDRMGCFLGKNSTVFPSNYHLTFSRSENNWLDCVDVMHLGGNIAVVFEELPEQYAGLPVIDGDEHDLRFLDPSPCIVGLSAKGRARTDMTGFRVRKEMLPEGYTPLLITA